MGRPKKIANLKEYLATYYQEHKEQYKKPRETCKICNKEVGQMYRHIKTTKHIKLSTAAEQINKI